MNNDIITVIIMIRFLLSGSNPFGCTIVDIPASLAYCIIIILDSIVSHGQKGTSKLGTTQMMIRILVKS